MIVVLPAALGVNITKQDAVAPVPVRLHVPALNVPAVPLCVNVTVPVGVVGVKVSVTVAVQLAAWPTTTVEGVHKTWVVVES